MKNLKLKFAFFSLLAAMTLTVFMTSCEQETITPETTDIPGISAEFKAYVENLDPEVFTSSEPIPQRTPENTVNADLSDRNCPEFNRWHYSPDLGWCFIVGEGEYYGLDVRVFSEKYGVYGIVFKMDLCNASGTSIYAENLCGKTGWFWDNNGADVWIRYYSNNGIQFINCPGIDRTNRDYIALRALYLSTDGDNWIDNMGWPTAAQFAANPTMPTGTDLDTWIGIKANSTGV